MWTVFIGAAFSLSSPGRAPRHRLSVRSAPRLLQGLAVTGSSDVETSYTRVSVRIVSCTFVKLSSDYGGALRAQSCGVTISKSTFSDCSAAAGGCLSLTSSSLDVYDSSFSRAAADSGGAISASRGPAAYSLNLRRCIFRCCSARRSAGALIVRSAEAATVSDSTFERCDAAQSGGATLIESSGCSVARTLFVGCAGRDGNAIGFVGGRFRLATKHCFFIANGASADVVVSGVTSYESTSDRFLKSRQLAFASRDHAGISAKNTLFAGDEGFWDSPPASVFSESQIRFLVSKAKALTPSEVADGLCPRAQLLAERAPAFVGPALREESPENVLEIFHADYDGESHYDRRFRRSIVHVNGSTFTDCTALGNQVDGGLGGAICVIESQLRAFDAQFINCAATLGGGIGSLDSDSFVVDTSFHSCRSRFQGGGADFRFSSSVEAKSYAKDSVVFLGHCVFTDCISLELAGGIGFMGIQDATLDNCEFLNNTAGLAGGGVELDSRTKLLIFRSHFRNNSGRTRGGAITVTDVPLSEGVIEPLAGDIKLATEQCCFARNTAATALDIYAGGTYQSYDDRFLNDQAVAIIGEDVLTYHSRFYPSDGFFVDGHPCASPEYRDAYDSYSRPPPNPTSIIYEGYYTTRGISEAIEQSDPEQTPYATRLPPATPLGRSQRTTYPFPGTLIVPHLTVHQPATASSVFLSSAVSSPSQRILISLNAFGMTVAVNVSCVLEKSGTFTPHPTRTELPPATGVPLTTTLPESSGLSITVSLTIIGVFISPSNVVITTVNEYGSTVTMSFIVNLTFPEYAAIPSYVTLAGLGAPVTTADGGRLSPGALIGIVAGSAVVAALIIGAVIYIIRRRGQFPIGEGGQKPKKHGTKSATDVDYSDDSGETGVPITGQGEALPMTDFGSQGSPYIFTQNVADIGGGDLWL